MRLRKLAIAVSLLSMVSVEQSLANNSGAAFVGGVIGGAIGSAIVNGQKKPAVKKKAVTKKPPANRNPAVTKKKTTPAAGTEAVAEGAPWMAMPMPNGLMVATNAQGLTFTYDVHGRPRMVIQSMSAVQASSVGLIVPVSIVVDGIAFGLLQAKAEAGGLVIDDPQVLGLEQRLKPAHEVTVTSTMSTITVKLSGFSKAIDQLGMFRQQQAILAAANTQATPANNEVNVAAVAQQAASGTTDSITAEPSALDAATATQPAVELTNTAAIQPLVEPTSQASQNPDSSTGSSAQKVALIIGNSAYQNAGRLANPKNDASAMSEVLRGIGFKVIVSTDATKAAMETSIREFIQEAKRADVSLFFYAGHGMEVAGENFLLPVDTKLEDESALSFEVINSKIITNAMGGDNKVGIILLDACRDNPFTSSLRRAMVASRAASVSNGLAPIQTEGGGLVVAFATAPGAVAADGEGVNSPFTTALIKWLPQKGLEIDQVMKRVKAEVASATKNDQRPWTNSDLTSDVFLAGKLN